MNDKDEAVAEYLLSINVKFSAIHRGEAKDGDWEHDLWYCSFNRGLKARQMELEYRTGTGHRVVMKGYGSNPGNLRPGTIGYANWKRQLPMTAVAPSAASVLHSVVMDSSADSEPFGDWCSNLGYEEDSRKALETYLLCQAQSQMFRKAFDHAERAALEKLLEDY